MRPFSTHWLSFCILREFWAAGLEPMPTSGQIAPMYTIPQLCEHALNVANELNVVLGVQKSFD